MHDIQRYIGPDDTDPFQDWFDRLDAATAARLAIVIERMRQGNLGDCKSVGEGVMERRVDHGPGYRLYFGRDGDRLIILLAGGSKQRQQRDIAAAILRWADYKRRKAREK